MSLITLSGAEVTLDGRSILRNISMNVDAGEIITIVGPNGSGKSTLLRAIIGAVKLTAGSVTWKSGLRIGYVPQRLYIDPTMPLSVSRFLDLPNKSPRKKRGEIIELTGIGALVNEQMTNLSGGQFQRVLLARAILDDPEILILDEANQGLDQPATAAFYKLISDLRKRLNCAVLMVSHDLHVVMSASDRVICLNGHVCCHGTPESVSNAPEYRELFGLGTQGALALYRHAHDHSHDHDHLSDKSCLHD